MNMSIKVALKQAILMLNQIHVRGSEAGMLDGAIKNIEACIRAIEEAEKEGAGNANQGEQR